MTLVPRVHDIQDIDIQFCQKREWFFNIQGKYASLLHSLEIDESFQKNSCEIQPYKNVNKRNFSLFIELKS